MHALAPELFDACNRWQLIDNASRNQNFARELGATIVKCDTEAVLCLALDVGHFLLQ